MQKLLAGILVLIAVTAFTLPKTYAQDGSWSPRTTDELVLSMAENCAGQWQAQNCLREVSDVMLHLAASYAGNLQDNGQTEFVDSIKENCSAATAAKHKDIPVYALNSAMTQCINMIYDISEKSGLKPDHNLYQLAVGSTFCLKNLSGCDTIESQLLAILERQNRNPNR